MTKHEPENVRVRLVKAAEDLLVSEGLAGLTLEAVAKEAGVSKGGLLYHFSTKEDLIAALVEGLIEQWRSSLQVHLDREPAGPGQLARAFASLMETDPLLHDRAAEKTKRHRGICSAVMVAAKQHPELLDPVRRSYQEFFQQAARDANGPGTALLMMALLDGLWFGASFDLYEFSPEQKTALKKELDRILNRL